MAVCKEKTTDCLDFCLASEKDFEQVLAISEGIFDGLDYMAVTYHRWLQEPGRLVFLAKKDGRVVALDSALLVDGGETVVVQGLRVAPALQGQGIAGAIQRHVRKHIRENFPQVTAFRLCRGDKPGPKELAKYRLLAKEAILSLHCEVGDLGPFLVELQQKLGKEWAAARETVILSHEEAERLILHGDVVQNLLPGGTIINDWEPLKPIEANLDILRRRGLTWVADCPNQPAALSLCTTPYAVPYRHDALHFNINIFGCDLGPACAVFLRQLRNLLPALSGYLIFYTYVHPSIWPGLRRLCQTSANVLLFRDYWEELLLEADISVDTNNQIVQDNK